MTQDAERQPLADLIRELSNEIIQIQRWAAEQSGLNNTDLMALYFMRNGEGAVTPTLLSQHLGLTSGATAILLNRLERRGYVIRTAHPSDRRAVLLSLGPSAQSEGFLNLSRHLQSVNAEVIDALSPDEARVVRRFLASVISNTRDALQQMRALASSGSPERDALE